MLRSVTPAYKTPVVTHWNTSPSRDLPSWRTKARTPETRDRMNKGDDVICHRVQCWIENTDFRHQYFNWSLNCLQDICCIIKSEPVAVGSMSRVILSDRRNPFSALKRWGCCTHVFSGCGTSSGKRSPDQRIRRCTFTAGNAPCA